MLFCFRRERGSGDWQAPSRASAPSFPPPLNLSVCVCTQYGRARAAKATREGEDELSKPVWISFLSLPSLQSLLSMLWRPHDALQASGKPSAAGQSPPMGSPLALYSLANLIFPALPLEGWDEGSLPFLPGFKLVAGQMALLLLTQPRLTRGDMIRAICIRNSIIRTAVFTPTHSPE